MKALADKTEHHVYRIKLLRDNLHTLADGIEYGMYKDTTQANAVRVVAMFLEDESEALMESIFEMNKKK